MSQEFSQNFWKITSQFLGKKPTARFFNFCISCLLLTFLNTFSVTSLKSFSELFQICSKFYPISTQFLYTCSFSKLIPHFLTICRQKVPIFFAISEKLFEIYQNHQISMKKNLKLVQRVPKFFSIIF